MRSAGDPNLSRRRICWAVLVSVAGHGVLAWWIGSQPAAPVPPVRLEISLLSSEPSTVPAGGEPVAPASDPVPREPIADNDVEVPRSRVRQVLTPDSAEPPVVVLNLDRPPDWEALIREAPRPPGLPFSATLNGELAVRREEQQRELLLARRVAAVYGVADAAYTRYGPRGVEMKTDGRCVTLIEDTALERGARWWAGPCRDTRQSPFTLAPLEIDGLGRAVAD